MQKSGHSVVVLTYGYNETEDFRSKNDFLIKEYIYQGVPVISFRYREDLPQINFAVFDTEMENFLDSVFSDKEFDIVHICHPMRAGSILNVAKKRNIPIVLTLTDFWLMCPKGIAVTQRGELCTGPEKGVKCISECYGNSEKDILIHRFNDAYKYIQSVNCVVSPTKFLKNLFEMNNFSNNIKLIRFGKDYTNVRYNSKTYSKTDEITIGYLSSVLPHKGAHVLLEAFRKANMRNTKIKFHGSCFHDTDYYNELKDLAINDDKVEFHGPYEYKEMPQILDEIDVLAVPSIWWENSPLVMLRALAHNIPVIVSDLGGLTEVVKDGENGFVFEAGNSQSLAKILQMIGEDPEILNEMKAKINHPPRIEEEVFEYEKLYLDLIRNSQK